MRVVPSIYAESAHESRSQRYAHIPTAQVLRGLQSEGFLPFFAVEARSRIESKRGFTKHMIRMRHVDSLARGSREDVNEIILVNSHDGASSYQMMAGTFRFVCLNGLVCGSSVGELRVRHSGNVQDEVVEGALGMLKSFEVIDASKSRMKSLQLTSGEQTAFARAALAVRYPEENAPPIQAEQIIEPRRWADRDNSLWATFNRAQEHLVSGGLRTNDRTRRTRTRAVNGIDGSLSLNRGLWTLAEEMLKLKNA